MWKTVVIRCSWRQCCTWIVAMTMRKSEGGLSCLLSHSNNHVGAGQCWRHIAFIHVRHRILCQVHIDIGFVVADAGNLFGRYAYCLTRIPRPELDHDFANDPSPAINHEIRELTHYATSGLDL